MTEIEKMYENAGFKKDLPINLADLDFSEEDCDELCLDNSCDECRYKTYPPFTAEKQLKIMELFVRKSMLLFTFSTKGNYKVSGFCKGSDYCSDIKEAFANYINNLWQSLTDQEKEEIRRILNE